MLIHGLITRWLTGSIPFTDENANLLNDVERCRQEKRRLYCYGTADDMVSWRDVEYHANQAESRGLCVRREKFEDDRHVTQIRVDADRYWGAVKETWEQK